MGLVLCCKYLFGVSNPHYIHLMIKLLPGLVNRFYKYFLLKLVMILFILVLLNAYIAGIVRTVQ